MKRIWIPSTAHDAMTIMSGLVSLVGAMGVLMSVIRHDPIDPLLVGMALGGGTTTGGLLSHKDERRKPRKMGVEGVAADELEKGE